MLAAGEVEGLLLVVLMCYVLVVLIATNKSVMCSLFLSLLTCCFPCFVFFPTSNYLGRSF